MASCHFNLCLSALIFAILTSHMNCQSCIDLEDHEIMNVTKSNELKEIVYVNLNDNHTIFNAENTAALFRSGHEITCFDANGCVYNCMVSAACFQSIIICASPVGCNIICNANFACSEMQIHASGFVSGVSIICYRNSCEAMVVNLNGVGSAHLYCSGDEACQGLEIYFQNMDHMSASVTCSTYNACGGIRIYADDSNDIPPQLNMYQYSEAVQIHIKRRIDNYGEQFVQCGFDLDNKFIEYPFNATNNITNTMQQLVAAEISTIVDGSLFLPCDGVNITLETAPDTCSISYTYREEIIESLFIDNYTNYANYTCAYIALTDILNLTTNCKAPTSSPTIMPTLNPSYPTIDPTRVPSNDPSTNPTFNPSIRPSINPNRVPTIEPTINQNPVATEPTVDLTATMDLTGTIAIIVSCCLMGIICVIIIIIYYKRTESRHEMEAITINISNPMVISIAIGEYDKSPENAEIDAHLTNLDAVEIDIRNVINLFGKQGLNYIIAPDYENKQEYRIRWTQQELIQFLNQQSDKLEQNLSDDGSQQSFNYDGLIVIISCHGLENHILTSDYKKINKTAVHRIFSAKKPLTRKIPRIFIFDCCSGDGSRQGEYRFVSNVGANADQTKDGYCSIVNDETIKSIEVNDIYRQTSLIWAKNEDNPDYKLVIINAANEGFQSKMSISTGSYVITLLMEKLKDNIYENNNAKFFNDILDDIQDELHERGKQLMVKTFNNKTEYIKFRNCSIQQGRAQTSAKYVSVDTDEVDELELVEGINTATNR